MFKRSVLIFAICISFLSAQTQSRLDGVVSDSTGAVIAGATVVARNVATGVTYTAKTNETGIYTMPFLPPAEYELTGEMAGFKKAVRGGVILETASTQTVNLRMEVGDVNETVAVTAAAQLLEAETSSIGQFVERATVANMPLQSRRSASLVRLSNSTWAKSRLPAQRRISAADACAFS